MGTIQCPNLFINEFNYRGHFVDLHWCYYGDICAIISNFAIRFLRTCRATFWFGSVAIKLNVCIVLFFTDLITKLEPSTKARDVHTILARVVLGVNKSLSRNFYLLAPR